MASTTDSQSQSTFQKVPLEVLLRMTWHLTTPDLGSFRLTCRSIERSLYTTFTQEFFSKRQFMLTEASLQALIDISKSRLSDCLTQVIIGLDRYQTRPYTDMSYSGRLREVCFRNGMVGQFTLLNTGQDRDMLAEAFRNLRNLSVVGIRDYANPKRRRDEAKWVSYGAATVRRETGVDLMQVYDDDAASNFCSQVFALLLSALGHADARPDSIEVLRRRAAGLRDKAFNIPKYFEPNVLPVLANLKSLLLSVTVDTSAVAYIAEPGDGVDLLTVSGTVPCPDYFLRNFLAHVPNLTHLRLNFVQERDAAESTLVWLGSPANVSATAIPLPDTSASPSTIPPSPSPAAFSSLARLDLGFLMVQPKHIISILQKLAPTLKWLEFYTVTLQTWNNLDPPVQISPETRVSYWTKFFDKLRQVPGLDLEHIMVGELYQEQFQHPRRKISFKSLSRPNNHGYGPRIIQKRQYTGIDWKHFLQDLASEIEVDWPVELSEDENDDEDEEESDYELA